MARMLRDKYGIPQSMFNCLLEHISNEMECTKAQGENIGCKFLQPDNSPFCDSIEQDQQVIMWVDTQNGEPVLRCIYRKKVKKKNKSIIPFEKVLSFEGIQPMLQNKIGIDCAVHH
jgi:hypothetical protein